MDYDTIKKYTDDLINKGDYKTACEIHKKALETSIKTNNKKFIIKFHKLLSIDYEKLKDFKNSTKHIKAYMELREEWFVDQNNKYTEILLKKYDILGKENKIYELTYIKDILIDKRNKDALTGLLNRRFLNEYISKDLNQYKPCTEILSVLMIDIDYFKKYNDKYGHIKGDEVISEIGKVLNEICCTQKYMGIRYGGEEFLLLLQDTDESEAVKIAEEILNKVVNLNIEHVESLIYKKITVSIGISTSEYIKDYNEVIDQADKGLYLAKRSGKNKYVFIKESLVLS
ncbi:MAG: GGDEF domain-containing protein [Romboutsia sp.]|uniref:GGDEF domain-containing protein n=1 Tax=Romboutsia sp. TaxID=1965302 RepID=UPI003F2FF033